MVYKFYCIWLLYIGDEYIFIISSYICWELLHCDHIFIDTIYESLLNILVWNILVVCENVYKFDSIWRLYILVMNSFPSRHHFINVDVGVLHHDHIINTNYKCFRLEYVVGVFWRFFLCFLRGLFQMTGQLFYNFTDFYGKTDALS